MLREPAHVPRDQVAVLVRIAEEEGETLEPELPHHAQAEEIHDFVQILGEVQGLRDLEEVPELDDLPLELGLERSHLGADRRVGGLRSLPRGLLGLLVRPFLVRVGTGDALLMRPLLVRVLLFGIGFRGTRLRRLRRFRRGPRRIGDVDDRARALQGRAQLRRGAVHLDPSIGPLVHLPPAAQDREPEAGDTLHAREVEAHPPGALALALQEQAVELAGAVGIHHALEGEVEIVGRSDPLDLEPLHEALPVPPGPDPGSVSSPSPRS